jgi:hypothetical protein
MRDIPHKRIEYCICMHLSSHTRCIPKFDQRDSSSYSDQAVSMCSPEVISSAAKALKIVKLWLTFGLISFWNADTGHLDLHPLIRTIIMQLKRGGSAPSTATLPSCLVHGTKLMTLYNDDEPLNQAIDECELTGNRTGRTLKRIPPKNTVFSLPSSWGMLSAQRGDTCYG